MQAARSGVGSQQPSQGQGGLEAAGERMADTAILRQLANYVLPHGNPEYRWRIGAALAFLVASKGLNVAVSLARSQDCMKHLSHYASWPWHNCHALENPVPHGMACSRPCTVHLSMPGKSDTVSRCQRLSVIEQFVFCQCPTCI